MSLLNEKYLYANACRFISDSAEVEQLDEVTMDVPLAVFRKLKAAGIDTDMLRDKSVDELADLFAGSSVVKNYQTRAYKANRAAAIDGVDVDKVLETVKPKIISAAELALADLVPALEENKFISYNKDGKIALGFASDKQNQAVYNHAINFAWDAIKETMRKNLAPKLAATIFADVELTAAAMNKKISVIYEAIYNFFKFNICGKNEAGQKATAENFAGIKAMIGHAIDNQVAKAVVEAEDEIDQNESVKTMSKAERLAEARKTYVIDDSMLYETFDDAE